MKFTDAIEVYVAEMFAQGRFRSPRTADSYRIALLRHADDIDNRDPRTVNRDDVKRTLGHWSKPNTRANKRAILVSFFDFCMEEGWRKDNPARQTRRPKRTPTTVYRLTKSEASGMLAAASGPRERRAIYLGICAGLRNAELRGLQGRHLQRPGWVWVSQDIAKGGRERWVPVIADLAPVADEIRRNVEPEQFVLPAQRWRDPGVNRDRADKQDFPSSSQALRSLVARVAMRAGIVGHIHPHLLRHAFGDHIARYAGMRNAQFLLGHAGVSTTESYVGRPTLDELATSVDGFGFGTHVLPPAQLPRNPAPGADSDRTGGLSQSYGNGIFAGVLALARPTVAI